MKSGPLPTLRLALLLLAGAMATGCDTGVESIRDAGDRYIYSMHGLLDASVDTQWVRVMPFRTSFRPGNEPIDARVTIEHLESGELIEWRDSLFHYGSLNSWNFWMAEPLEPGGTYQLTAHRSDGKSSDATFTIPALFPHPLVELGGEIRDDREILFDQITLYGIERLAYVFLYFELTIDHERILETYRAIVPDKRHFRFAVTHLAEPTGTPGEWRLTIDRRAMDLDFAYDMESILPFPVAPSNLWDYITLERGQVEAIAATEDWPPFESLTTEEIELPEGISNVRNGLGFVNGILGVTVPFETCTQPGTGAATPCPAEPTMTPDGLVKVVYDHD